MKYEIRENRMYRVNDEGESTLMCNFVASIIEEIRYLDGANSETFFKVAGVGPNYEEADEEPVIYDAITMPATTFGQMGWVVSNWGSNAIIQPGNVKDDLRAAIQGHSRPAKTTVYKHMGWDQSHTKYLHAGGAITKDGNDASVRVQLPQELQNYVLDVGDKTTTKRAVQATLALMDLAPPEITWTTLAATLAPLFGPIDFAIHITGRTGSFKSEFTSLFQSHYGSKMDARHLPGSWSSTANALEAQAYYAKNAVFVVDDFVPIGSTHQQRTYQTTADKIIRSQGNQSGRARLTDTSNLQIAMYPRGLILSTGEDTPEGHSVRARMMIMELAPNDISASKLTAAQANREIYIYTIGGLIQHLTKSKVDLTATVNSYRDANIGIGHTRTPPMIGRLTATILYFLAWAESIGAVTKAEAKLMAGMAVEAIKTTGDRQTTYLETSDPTEQFAAGVRDVLGRGLGHLRTPNGGVPFKADLVGWTVTRDDQSPVPMHASKGPCIGWINWNEGELWLNAELGYNVVQKSLGSSIGLTKNTLIKRLKEADMLTRVDESRKRNTVRVTAGINGDKHPHLVLSLSIPKVLQLTEADNGEESSSDDTGDDDGGAGSADF